MPPCLRGLAVALMMLMTAQGISAQTEKIAEIRVHGNHTTPDSDILAIAGLTIGEPASESALMDAQRKLRDSRRFESAEVLRRYRSIANADEILVMLVVDEQPAVDDRNLTPGPLKKLRAATMWLPIVNYADGYGFTYGAQLAIVEPLGPRTRLSVPLTWGGDRRGAVELERTFDNGPLDTVRGTVSVSRRINPFFLASDRRVEAKVRGERAISTWLRAGASARMTDNAFELLDDLLDDRTRAVGADVTLDTSVDPSFPRNAIQASTRVERMAFDVGAPGRTPDGPAPSTAAATRWTNDVRGYIGVGGANVLALRGSMIHSSTALPLFEQSLLGGSGSLRGYRTGYRAGDNIATMSIELRVPLNSPLTAGRFGVKTFVDWGTAWQSGGRLQDQRFERGIGGGVYFGGGPVILDLDVAWPESGNPRAHFGLGVRF